jgi:DNA-binding transcriptional MerR regulator
VRIKAASQALEVPVPTLRRWTQEFSVGLSPEARASEGRPREFTPRDMRVLRRAKDILKDKEVTYERARRMLGGEGLLQYEAESNGASASGSLGGSRDEAADRAAAERFVRDVVARELAGMREAQTGLMARIGELEREVRTMREQGRGPARPVETTGGVTGIVARDDDPNHRRTWPFR